MPKTGKSPAPAARKTKSAKSAPTHEEIALRAYQIYLERGGTPGNELEDWTRAERELMGKNGRLRRKISPNSMAA